MMKMTMWVAYSAALKARVIFAALVMLVLSGGWLADDVCADTDTPLQIKSDKEFENLSQQDKTEYVAEVIRRGREAVKKYRQNQAELEGLEAELKVKKSLAEATGRAGYPLPAGLAEDIAQWENDIRTKTEENKKLAETAQAASAESRKIKRKYPGIHRTATELALRRERGETEQSETGESSDTSRPGTILGVEFPTSSAPPKR